MVSIVWLGLLTLSSSALRTDAVRMLGAGASGSRHVLAGQPALLECRFQLEPDETLTGVTWTKDSHLVYRWLLGNTVTVLGVLEDLNVPASSGWNIQIDKATTGMAGNYSCSVHTDRGSAASRRFPFVVLLVCKALIETEDSTSVNCTVGWRVTCSRVFPELNLTAGVFLPEENKFFDRVAEWTKVVYSDNTFGFTAFKSYYVADIPKSSIFLWSLGYKDQIPLATGNVSAGAVHQSGCPAPPPSPSDSSTQVQVIDARPTCRGELAGASRAVYSCANEIPHSSEQAVKELVCDSGEWVEKEPGTPWPHC